MVRARVLPVYEGLPPTRGLRVGQMAWLKGIKELIVWSGTGWVLIGGLGGGPQHNLLSVIHPDTLAASPTRGALVVGNSTPAWALISLGATGRYLRSNGTDALWAMIQDGDIPASIARDSEVSAAITAHEGLPDPHGVYLTPAEHTAIGDGSPHHAAVTVSGEPDYITLAGQDIVRGLIDLVNDVTGLLAWASLNKVGSSLADLATRAHSDLSDAPPTAHHDNANDPSAGQKAALAGTSGTPGDANRYVTNADPRNTDDRTPVAHGLSKHTGKVGEAPLEIKFALKNPLAAGDNRAALDYRWNQMGSSGRRISKVYARARDNLDTNTTFQLKKNGAVVSGATVTIPASARVPSPDQPTSFTEVVLSPGDVLDVTENAGGSTQQIAVDFDVLGDQDVVAEV